MFERFTDRARRALVVAQKHAHEFGHGRITPAHILLALSEEGSGLAERALVEAGVDVAGLRARVAASSGSHSASRDADMLPFSPQAKKVLELSLREALRLGDKHIGTEHLLLGVLKFDEGIEVLLGVPITRVRAQVVALVQGSASRPALSPALTAAMDRARRAAGAAPMTSGHLLAALLDDGDSQAAKGLTALGVTTATVREALAQVPAEGTSDAEPEMQPIELKVGDTSIEVTDEALVARLRAASPREILGALAAYFHGRSDRDDDKRAIEMNARARIALELAQEEARLLKHGFVGTEHILLGLIHEGDGVAAKVLDSLGVSLTRVRTKVEETIGTAGGDPVPSPPFTPRAKKVLELSRREALELGHHSIGTEHLLLGIVREGEGVGAQVLVGLGVEPDRVRTCVLELVSGHTG
jgi:ATP-dependent Clp protease ATP-binding subunit ClpA